jgi:hypothetical protein
LAGTLVAGGIGWAAVTGLDYSLVYPGFGVEAVKHVPPQDRGLAMGAYTAFLDLALGLANPALWLIAGGAPARAYFVSTLASALGVYHGTPPKHAAAPGHRQDLQFEQLRRPPTFSPSSYPAGGDASSWRVNQLSQVVEIPPQIRANPT